MIKIKKERVLITPQDIEPSSKDYEVIGVINPGAARLPNGNIILYVRIIEKLKKIADEKYCYSPRFVGKENFEIKLDKFNKKSVVNKTNLDFYFKDGTKRLTFISHLRRVFLDENGFDIKSIEKKPSFYGVSWDGELGIEDARITKINGLYIMTYVVLSRKENISTSYAISSDCINWYRRGIIFGEQNKDVVLFPELINKKYVAFDRPEGSFQFSLPHMWVSYSKDLEYWGKSKPLSLYKKGDWDYGKNGAGPPPIKTKNGWLLLYHTVMEKEEIRKKRHFIFSIKKVLGLDYQDELETKHFYSVGAALFDLNNPEKLISKSKFPIIFPVDAYEREKIGAKRIIFPTGIVIAKNNKDLLIYFGEGDIVTTVKKVSLDNILKSLEFNKIKK